MADENQYPFWISEAHKYSKQHPSVIDVTKTSLVSSSTYSFVANFEVVLPGKFDLKGETPKGVRKIEPVEFVFTEEFPYHPPDIFLRDDFSRDFAHINPSKDKVCPCVYEGNLGDLLQQPKWFDHILDQVADWLEKAAANNLIDYKQGWEPMRTDNLDGYIWYSTDQLAEEFAQTKQLSPNIHYLLFRNITFLSGRLFTNAPISEQGITKAFLFCMKDGDISDRYIPNYISTLSDLQKYALDSGISELKKTIDSFSGEMLKFNKTHFVVVLGIRRPAKMINGQSELEFLNFAVELKCQKDSHKTHMKSKVLHLSHEEICTSDLLRRFSGVTVSATKKKIIHVGCGSLGSKICIHLARNGNDDFVLIDKGMFSPHNNARHGCVNFSRFIASKANLLKMHLATMNISSEEVSEDVIQYSAFSKSDNLVIDSTASLAVRNFLSSVDISGTVIHTSLYDHGRLGVLAVEGENRNPRVDDHLCRLFSECLNNRRLRNKLLADQSEFLSTGQGCGSYTTRTTDSRISLSATGMANRIQEVISNEIPEKGELLVGSVGKDDMGISWENIQSGKTVVINKGAGKNWEVRILSHVATMMSEEANKSLPSETGGVLIGHISLINNCITVTDLFPAPEDSIMTEVYFELGTKGLRKKIDRIHRNSNGLLTYVGTWHSHTSDSAASSTDRKTKKRLLVLRDYEPTVCLIWTPGGIIRV